MATSATRVGDSDIAHTEPTFRSGGSPNVFVNGVALSREGDVNTLHHVTNDSDSVHQLPITNASKTVFINGQSAGRVGDSVGCTVVGQGSGNVFIG